MLQQFPTGAAVRLSSELLVAVLLRAGSLLPGLRVRGLRDLWLATSAVFKNGGLKSWSGRFSAINTSFMETNVLAHRSY